MVGVVSGRAGQNRPAAGRPRRPLGKRRRHHAADRRASRSDPGLARGFRTKEGCGVKALDATDQTTITVHVPMTFTVRGGRKTILSDAVPAPPQPRIDNALLKALARAPRWRRIIEGGEYGGMSELAKSEGINQA